MIILLQLKSENPFLKQTFRKKEKYFIKNLNHARKSNFSALFLS
jgi:hypothetical protein